MTLAFTALAPLPRASAQTAPQTEAQTEVEKKTEPGLFNDLANLFNPQRIANAGPPPADAVPYALTINVHGDSDLRKAIEAASNLETLKQRDPSGAAGLVRRALADQRDLTAALYSAGYYAGIVRITIAGNAPDAPNIFQIVEAAHARGHVPIVVDIEPGQQFHFGEVRLLDAKTGRPLADSPTFRALRMVPGEPALATQIVRAEGIIVDYYRQSGHPFVHVVDRDIVADHATHKLDVTMRVDTGPRATFGRFTVSGADFLTPNFIEDRIEIPPGTPYSPEVLNRLRRRLLTYESIGGVRINEASKLDSDGTLPIEIVVTGRKPRYFGFSATYSSTDGSLADVFWGHRNLFGGGETLRLDAQVSWFGEKPDAVPDADPFGYKLSASFMKPGIYTAQDDLLANAAVLREVTNAYVREAVTFLAGVRHRFNDQLSLQVSLDLEQSRVEDSTGTRDYSIIGIPFYMNYDSTDNELDPSRGIRFSGTVEPYAYLGEAGAGTTMVDMSFSTYHAFDEEKRYILAGRVSGGSVIGASNIYDVPPQRRFYVGGGGTVRGYDYQSISPRDADDIIIGGLSYFVASAEARIRVTDTIGIVPFVDMGAAFSSATPDFDGLKYSAGIGLRYYTAVGPLRLDLAFPINPGPDDGDFGLYVSLGQAF
ncbi:autotransporter assembly complex protein TamA [Ancylobacter pratisalsi]|uniref:Outer membrane protein assembly factor n=1 Tax=Ancylobacter pratisalsi TaxID=1745854 RepID=A0A6P1YJK5_9HYPH|nr:autotransporter assembly complex family protein [Ancylobacter pratisalsi]QIB32413.1 outer membrane protein assembly factor [Ancylobacter pratisalsi]